MLSVLAQAMHGLFSDWTVPLPQYTTTRENGDVRDDAVFDGGDGEFSKYRETTSERKSQFPNAAEIAAEMSEEQIQHIAHILKKSANVQSDLHVQDIVREVLNNPSIKNVINNYNILSVGSSYDKTPNEDDKENVGKIVTDLKNEIDVLRDEMLRLNELKSAEISGILVQLQSNGFKYEEIDVNVNTCKPKIEDINDDVLKIVKDFLGIPPNLVDQEDIVKWLQTIFVAKTDLDARLSKLTLTLKTDFEAIVNDNRKLLMDQITLNVLEDVRNTIPGVTSTSAASADMSEDRVRKIVRDVLSVYDADKTGLVDYALESSGGQIVSTKCTEIFQSKTALISIFGFPLWYVSNTPRKVITPGTNAGDCWAFQNFPGFLVIKLYGRVNVQAFSMEHLSRLLSPHGDIDSAPKTFQVYGLEEEHDNDPSLLGEYLYDSGGEPLQFFTVERKDAVYDMIQLKILSNHGNPNYTCIYRFRVHGVLHATSR